MWDTMPIVALSRHELHDCDGQIDLWELTKHTIGQARSLVAYAERDLEGAWTTYTVHPPEAKVHADRFHAWMHLYRHALVRENPADAPSGHAEPLTEQQGH